MNNNINYSQDYVSKEDKAYTLTKVFGYMFCGLMITAAIMLGLSGLYRYLLSVDYTQGFNAEAIAIQALLATLIVSAIGLIVLSFIVPIMVRKGTHSVLVPAILYTVLMGVCLSTLTIFIPWYLLGVTFLITSLIFGLMALIALLSKERLHWLGIIGLGLVLGGGLISLFLWILMLVLPSGTITSIFWIVSLAVFAGMMCITTWDISRIKSIALEGEMTNNISLYCAYILYNDFIYIFMRVLRIVLIIYSKSK